MPRPGGESDKLGNRYEAVWTADSLLDVLCGDARSLIIEPFDEAGLGVEFIKELSNKTQQFHSVKRQTTGTNWSLYDLTMVGKSGRSILGDLLSKLAKDDFSTVKFVSRTAANELEELIDRAIRSQTAAAFFSNIAGSSLTSGFEKYFVPLCSNALDAYFKLKRIEVIGFSEQELIRRVEHRIRKDLYRIDGREVDAKAVRLLLIESTFEYYGQRIQKENLASVLENHGYRERIWARDKTLLNRLEERIALYSEEVECELINGSFIEREEADSIFNILISGSKKKVLIVAPAGYGKSCIQSQVIRKLRQSDIPLIVVRMDSQTHALTSEALGKELGFPTSPVGVLAGIANGSPSVLVIDQLDALSFVSGRNQELWFVFQELIREADLYPNIQILMGCRTFDIEHDTRLRRLTKDETKTLRVNLGALEVKTVEEVLRKAQIKTIQLNSKQLDLLRIPLHLTLYLQGNPNSHPPFKNAQDLFSRYWDRKQEITAQKLNRNLRWVEVIETLATWLSQRQTLSAPADVLDTLQLDAKLMASEHVIIFDGNNWRFFHEAFFDYAFARIFVNRNSQILGLLLSDEQHLFRRSQIRQILSFQRERDFNNYLRELTDILGESRVRFHVKKFVLDWMRGLDDPRLEEWSILQAFKDDETIEKSVRLVPLNSVFWFDVLQKAGTWKKWLDSNEPFLAEHAIWLLSLMELLKNRSAMIASLLLPYFEKPEWKNRLLRIVGFGHVHYSREFFNFFLRMIESGWFDDAHENWWHYLEDMTRENPEFAAELLGIYIDRLSRFGLTKPNPFDRDTTSQRGLQAGFVHALETANPTSFAKAVLPRVIREIETHTITSEDGQANDTIWGYLSANEEHSFGSAVYGSLTRSLQYLAERDPALFNNLIIGLEKLPQRSIAILLLTAWGANPKFFADKAIEYCLSNTRWLALGYSSWGSGNGAVAISRKVLESLAPHCSLKNYLALEDAIIGYRDPWERKHPKQIGQTEILLLNCLPASRMSPKAISRYEQLLRKFPDACFDPPRPIEVICVGSPIPRESIEKMNDDQWLSAMLKYGSSREKKYRKFGEGGREQLALELVHAAQKEKQRFASLCLRMNDSFAEEYFDAILRGLSDEQSNVTQSKNIGCTECLDTNTFLSVIRHLHALSDKNLGRSICSAVYNKPDLSYDDATLDILVHYAIHDSDPETELWKTPASGGVPYYGGDPVSAGINSVRGGAASAIAKLLFADSKRWQMLKPAVISLTRDSSLAVRSVATDCLLALLNFERSLAIQLFISLCNGAEMIWGTPSIEQFIYYAAQTHYVELRSLLSTMLQSNDKDVRKRASRQVAVASLTLSFASDDLAIVLSGDETMRSAAAQVFASNLGHDPVRATCRKHLKNLFKDPEVEVRKSAGHCFRSLSDTDLVQEEDLIQDYIKSPAFADGCEQLLIALEGSTAQLPDVICAIPERIISEYLSSGDKEPIEQKRVVYQLPELVIRLYEQTQNASTKTRCLDLIDKMLDVGFHSIESELNKIER